MVRAPTEAAIQKTCLALLCARGVLAWRNNSGAFVGEHKGKRRLIRFGMRGASDLYGVLPDSGRFLAVEIKRPGNRPTAAQLAFLKAVNAAGGVGFWVDDSRYLDLILAHVLAGASVSVDDRGTITIDHSLER